MENLKAWIVSFIIAMIVLGLGHLLGDKEMRQHLIDFLVTYFPFFMAFEAFLLYWAIIGMYKGLKKSSKPLTKNLNKDQDVSDKVSCGIYATDYSSITIGKESAGIKNEKETRSQKS
jgi:hypothetical protein